jgi:hypothetical protein
MSGQPLPKSLQKLIADNPDKFTEGWTESVEFAGREHWLFIRSGWRNAVLDPVCPVHTIHESTVKAVMEQARGLNPCNCEECQREIE